MPADSLIFSFHVLFSLMDLYVVNMMQGASMLTHISLLQASTLASMRYPHSRIYSHMVRTH